MQCSKQAGKRKARSEKEMVMLLCLRVGSCLAGREVWRRNRDMVYPSAEPSLAGDLLQPGTNGPVSEYPPLLLPVPWDLTCFVGNSGRRLKPGTQQVGPDWQKNSEPSIIP